MRPVADFLDIPFLIVFSWPYPIRGLMTIPSYPDNDVFCYWSMVIWHLWAIHLNAQRWFLLIILNICKHYVILLALVLVYFGSPWSIYLKRVRLYSCSNKHFVRIWSHTLESSCINKVARWLYNHYTIASSCIALLGHARLLHDHGKHWW